MIDFFSVFQTFWGLKKKFSSIIIVIIIIAVVVSYSQGASTPKFQWLARTEKVYFLTTSHVFDRLALGLLLPVSFRSMIQAEGAVTIWGRVPSSQRKRQPVEVFIGY